MSFEDLIEKVEQCQPLPEEIIRVICRRVKALLLEESSVQPVQVPVTVCGDIHGQFWDLLQIIGLKAWTKDKRYIFLGDYVDRGENSLETILLLFMLKLHQPDRVILLRGNHQTRNISSAYGFYDQVNRKYGHPSVWYCFTETFDLLPVGALIEGKIFCVHGGLSPYRVSIDSIRTLNRNCEIPESGPLCDLVWSDPDEEVEAWRLNSRGAGWMFGQKAVEEFFEINAVTLIVRAHQLVQEGFRQQFAGAVSTTWSAPNYCSRMNNRAAVMNVADDLSHSYHCFDASPRQASQVSNDPVLPYFL